MNHLVEAAIKYAVAAERERCAKVCERTGAYTDQQEMALMCAEGIREMNTETATLIAELHDKMEKMTPEDRLDVLRSLLGDYCAACGYDTGGRNCHCTNDE